KPAGHSGHQDHGTEPEHYCRFNRAFRVNKGSFGATRLDNIKFWMAGDLGGDFSTGQMDWAVVTFEPGVKNDQRDAIAVILKYLYPGKWNSFTVTKDGSIEWTASRDRAQAKLDGGKTAELALSAAHGAYGKSIVVTNLQYDGAPRNDGFILMPNDLEAY